MKRRHFLRAAAATAALLQLPARALEPTSWAAQFQRALADKPWLLAYKSVGREHFESKPKLTGKLPGDLRGVLYRNGPARHEIGDFRYQHWFDGDGMVQAFRFTDAGVDHQARIVATRKYQEEKAAGRALYPGFATIPPNPQPVTKADLVNVGNISMLHHHGKLLALWEVGSPWEIDPISLATKGLYQFSEETAGVPFSAHPRVDPDGTLWNFGYVSGAGLLVFWHVNARGRIEKMGTVKCDPISMPHDFVVTANHIVIMIPPLHYNGDENAGSFLDLHTWHPDKPTRVLVVNKQNFDDRQWLELPAQWVFHYGNGWEDEAGVIRFDGPRYDNPVVMIRNFREIMRGVTLAGTASLHHSYRIDTKSGAIAETPMFGPNLYSEFPAIDPRVSGLRNNLLVCLSADQNQPTPHGGLNSVTIYNDKTERLTTFQYPETQIPEEHLFVPKPGSATETSGWVVGTALDYVRAETLLNVFDVRALDAGPIATATLPYALPLGLHGKFV